MADADSEVRAPVDYSLVRGAIDYSWVRGPVDYSSVRGLIDYSLVRGPIDYVRGILSLAGDTSHRYVYCQTNWPRLTAPIGG